MIKIGLYSISCSGVWFNDRPALTVEEFIDTAKKFGYTGVEIDLKRPHGSPLDLNTKRCKEIREYIDKKGLELPGLAANNCFASVIPEVLENEMLMVREQIRVCKDMGAPILRVFPAWRGVVSKNGIASYDPTRFPEYYGANIYELEMNILACLKEVTKYAEDAGVVLALQNHEPIIYNYKDMLAFIKEVNSPYLKACFDAPCEGWTPERQSDEYISAATREVGDLQVFSHANGEFKELEDGRVEMIPYNLGGNYKQQVVTNYPAFFRTLNELGWDGYVNFEFCHMPYHNFRPLGYNDYIENQLRLAQIYLSRLAESTKE